MTDASERVSVLVARGGDRPFGARVTNLWVGKDKALLAAGIIEGGEVTDVAPCRRIGTNRPSHRRLL